MRRTVPSHILFILIVYGISSSPVSAQGISKIIAISNNAAPDGDGVFVDFGVPVLNASGQTAFRGMLDVTNNTSGIFIGAGGALTQVARTGQMAPIDGTFASFEEPALNASGQVVFRGELTGTSGGSSDLTGLFFGTAGSLTEIVREGQAAPDGEGKFASFTDAALNAAGQVAFRGEITGAGTKTVESTGIFLNDAGSLTQIARAEQSAPDNNGEFDGFGLPTLNAAGQVAFSGHLQSTIGKSSDNTGIFMSNGGALTQIARAGQSAPDGNGTFSDFTTQPALNASGQTAFLGQLTGTSGGANDNAGIFLGSSSGKLTQIIRTGEAAPDGNGTFSSFEVLNASSEVASPVLNTSGQTAFLGRLTGTSGGVNDNTGIFLAAGGELTQIARTGQATPDGNNTFIGFQNLALNSFGEISFHGFLQNNSGGLTPHGIYLANGMDMLQVARIGQTLAGSTVVGLEINHSTTPKQGSINDAGQVAYRAVLANGRQAIVRFTIPDAHWTAAGSGTWTTDANWTQQTTPNSFQDIFIQPDTSLTVTAPASNTTVGALTLGGGVGVATLRLAGSATGDLRAQDASTIADTGVLNLNDGRTFSTPMLQSSGTIRGHGTVDAVVNNSGRIESIGQEMTFSRPLTNDAPTGMIAGRDAAFRFNAGMTNNGTVALSFGTSDLFGNITNSANGTIAVAGNSGATFYNDLTNNGTLNVASGSTAVFFGTLAGNGNIGSGDVQTLGAVSPGESPGLMSFGGNLAFGPTTNLQMELAGRTLGAEYDHLDVAGQLVLDGTLEVLLVDGFVPSAGDAFGLFDFGTISGQFAQVVLPSLPDGRHWDTASLYATGVLSVVPEPGTVVLVLVGLLGMAGTSGRRRT